MADSEPVFTEYDLHYALSKILECVRRSDRGAFITEQNRGHANTAVLRIIAALEKFDEKLRANGRMPIEQDLPVARYAAMEFMKWINREAGDISNDDCAEVFFQYLSYRLLGMMRFEKQIDGTE